MRKLLAASVALVVYAGAAQAAPSRTERICARIQKAVAEMGIDETIAEALRRGYRMGTINHWRRICGV